MVHATASPAMTYGVETAGVANVTLMHMRSITASAVAPEACGKNPDLVLHAIDAAGSTIDPAFAAHTQPFRYWALAIWQTWVCLQELQEAFFAAEEHLRSGKATLWHKVAGPAAALLATAWRLGWTLHSAWEAQDDRGERYNMRLDPPCVIVKAVQRSVRRWRTARIAKAFPCLAHYTTTRCHTIAGEIVTLNRGVIDHAKVLGKTLGELRAGKHLTERIPRQQLAPMLTSAISGGQWPQVRLARCFTDDYRCYLCLSCDGTLLRWYTCPATTEG